MDVDVVGCVAVGVGISRIRGELSAVTRAIADCQWRGKSDRISRNGRDLFYLVGWAVASREPRHRCWQFTRGLVIWTLRIRRAIVISWLHGIVHVPRHTIALPDLRPTRETCRCRLPRGPRDLV